MVASAAAAGAGHAAEDGPGLKKEYTGPLGMHRFEPTTEQITPRGHREWATKMWQRINRDHSEFIDRKELECEEFQSILHAVLAPKIGGAGAHAGGAVYRRAQMNLNQAMTFFMRKADLNSDGNISFEEFKSALWFLRRHPLCTHTSQLIFSLFDLDQDGTIDESEFRELFRFFLGHNPPEDEFQKEWGRLDAGGRGNATRSEYIRWLQTSTNPVFHQHAPTEDALAAEQTGTPVAGRTVRQLPGLTRSFSSSYVTRPPWNSRFTSGVNMDPSSRRMHCPSSRKSYFSRPQSLPELSRHYDTHRGFKVHQERLQEPEPHKEYLVLSTENAPQFLRERAKPGGTMRNKATGKREMWEDFWQKPACLKSRYTPGSLDFRCPGPPPAELYAEENL